MSLTIRPALPEDLPAVHQLAEEIWWPTYSGILKSEQIRFMLDNMYSIEALKEQQAIGTEFLLVERDTKKVAFAGYSCKEETDKLSIHKLYVHPSEQGKGTGKFIIHHIEQIARNLGTRVLELNVNRYNKALHFYKKVGFDIFKKEDIPYYQYWMNDFILQKHLS
ncbi:GNAT family N-acetyltransferase [Arcticibacter sp.]|uniref:GNAT family N-acetyltransferase n=1 Tax=Arcticibacter sp. TaxID=1872630 RepID=UPI00388F8441